jgi:hypothetical protein
VLNMYELKKGGSKFICVLSFQKLASFRRFGSNNLQITR